MRLIAEGIEKSFRRGRSGSSFYAVRHMDFELAEGKLTEICGRSGGGKSTFLNIMGGLLKPDKGSVTLDGKDMYSLGDKELSKLRNKCIGVIPQGQTAIFSLNVLENVMLPYRLYGEDLMFTSYAMELMRLVGIEHLQEAMPRELSGGEMRRMAIARALICRPGILLADEPTGDLDDENTAVVMRLLRRIADEGTSVMLVTHEVGAAEYADMVYRMDGGALLPDEQ